MLAVASTPARPLARLLGAAPPSLRLIERFLEHHSFPLQEGRVTSFIYRGRAESVLLQHWIDGAQSPLPFQRFVDGELWHLSLELPDQARFEYKLEVVADGESRLIRDPLNPQLAHDPFGTNSVCYGPDYVIPDWTRLDPAAARGSLDKLTIASRAFGERREVAVYRPAGRTPESGFPVLLIHDGRDYLRYSDLRIVLDNLIHRGLSSPVVAALTDATDRLREYAGDPRHATFLAEELLPALEQRYRLAAGAADRGLMGASFGAVASLYTAWRYPRSFGRLLLQSGSFVAPRADGRRRGPEFQPVVAFTQLFRTRPSRVTDRVYVSCGSFEPLARHNRDLVEQLNAAGMEVSYRETQDGHNWENWRDRLGEGLSFLFPGGGGSPARR